MTVGAPARARALDLQVPSPTHQPLSHRVSQKSGKPVFLFQLCHKIAHTVNKRLKTIYLGLFRDNPAYRSL